MASVCMCNLPLSDQCYLDWSDIHRLYKVAKVLYGHQASSIHSNIATLVVILNRIQIIPGQSNRM